MDTMGEHIIRSLRLQREADQAHQEMCFDEWFSVVLNHNPDDIEVEIWRLYYDQGLSPVEAVDQRRFDEEAGVSHRNRNKRKRPGPLRAPSGSNIVGTLVVVPGFRGLTKQPVRDEAGIVHHTYAADDNVEMWWDESALVRDQDETIYVDAEGSLWRASQLIHVLANLDPNDKPWPVSIDVTKLLAALRAIVDCDHEPSVSSLLTESD